MPKAAVSASSVPAGSKVSETIVTKTEKPPITISGSQHEPDDGTPFKPWTKNIFEYVEPLTAEDWKIHAIRVYRYPLGEKKPRELGRYLVRFDAENPLKDEAQLTKMYGGGQYDFLVHRQRQLIFRDSFDIEGPSRNPDAVALAQGPVGSGELAATLNTVLQHLKGMQASGEQPPKLQETIQMITTLAQAIPKGEGITGLVTALASLDQLRGGGAKSELKETLELLRDMGIIGEKGESKKSIVEQMKDIFEIADMMRGGGRRDWVTSLIDAAPTIIEKAGTVLDKGAAIAENNRRIAEARRGIVVTEGSSASRAAAAPAAVVRTVAQPETEPVAPATSPTEPTVVIQPPTFEWLKARVVQLFREGKPGDVVAEFIDTVDPQLGNQFASLTRAQLEQFISTDAILGEIAEAPRYAAFVSEILSFFTEEAENPLTTAAAPG